MSQVSYIKPICDCSNELILTIHEMNSMDFRISDKGKILKVSVKSHKETYGQEFSAANAVIPTMLLMMINLGMFAVR